MTPYMCTVCGKAHSSAQEAKQCDHKKEQKKTERKTVKKTTSLDD